MHRIWRLGVLMDSNGGLTVCNLRVHSALGTAEDGPSRWGGIRPSDTVGGHVSEGVSANVIERAWIVSS